jgi:undecaprenyl-diphosphatase
MGQVWWLGLIQGLTEFLPVSSSGHLIILKHGFGVPVGGLILESWLHGGTLLAVFIAYRRDLKALVIGLGQRRPHALKELARIVIATIPAVVVGLILAEWLGSVVGDLAVVVGWLATTLVIWNTPKAQAAHTGRLIVDLHWREALWIGLAQAAALWPGLSRSGSTIFAGRRLGLSPAEAARLSFWMAIPTVTGAIMLTLIQDPQGLARVSLSWLIGLILAAISGLFAIKWIQRLLARPEGYQWFGWYTLGAGCAVLIGWWIGVKGL